MVQHEMGHRVAFQQVSPGNGLGPVDLAGELMVLLRHLIAQQGVGLIDRIVAHDHGPGVL